MHKASFTGSTAKPKAHSMWLPMYKLRSTVCGCCVTGILARLAQQSSSHAQMLTTGTLDTLLHLLSASFSAQIADDDLVWSTQASSVHMYR